MIGNKGICMCVGINQEMLNNLNPLTRNYLRFSCSQDLKEIFGGSYEYEKSRVKLFGFKTPNEYKNELARSRGFKSRWYLRWNSLKKKFKTKKEFLDSQVKKNGFKDYKDYQKNLVKNLGFSSLNEYKKFKYKELREFREENNLCVRCGSKKDNKFKMCLKCRKYFRK